MGAKPLRIRFHKINGYMKIYGGIRYLVLHVIKDIMHFLIEFT